MENVRTRALSDRVVDYLYAEGLRDEMMSVDVSITDGGKGAVMVSLTPYVYGCAACRARGSLPALVEAFRRQMGTGTRCGDCRDLMYAHWARKESLTPRLRALLVRAFTVEEVSPGNPFTSFMVLG